jgi:hypothetical protein
MPQFDIYLRNPVQWGIRQVRAGNSGEALEEARRLIENDPSGFELFYDGEFCDTVTHIRVCEPGANTTLAMWRSEDHGLRLFGSELLSAAETVVSLWHKGNVADAMRRLAAVVGKAKHSDE